MNKRRNRNQLLSSSAAAPLDSAVRPARLAAPAWAGLIDVRTSYEWDPAALFDGIPAAAILGVEAPLWSETVATINDVEFLAFPRLAAIAEVAWTPQADRRWDDFRPRLGNQQSRWTALGLNFHRSPEVPWR